MDSCIINAIKHKIQNLKQTIWGSRMNTLYIRVAKLHGSDEVVVLASDEYEQCYFLFTSFEQFKTSIPSKDALICRVLEDHAFCDSATVDMETYTYELDFEISSVVVQGYDELM